MKEQGVSRRVNHNEAASDSLETSFFSGGLRSLAMIAATLGALAVGTGCEEQPETVQERVSRQTSGQVQHGRLSASERDETRHARLAEVRDLGNGVHVFPAKYFAETLSDFIKANPGREIATINTGEQREDSSYTSGVALNFVVVTRAAPGLRASQPADGQ